MNVPQTVPPSVQPSELGLRVVYMLLFAVVFWLVCWVLAVTSVLQLVLRLLNGQPLAEVTRFGAGLGQYARHVVEFLTFATDVLPYPFARWPAG